MENQVGAPKTGKPVVTAAVVILVVALIAFAVARANNNDAIDKVSGEADADVAVTVPDTTTPTTPPATVPAEKPADGAVYKDGTYTATGEYSSPAGKEEIGVTLTLVDDVITDVSVTPMATVPISVRLQADFAANYKTLVVGKKIDEVNLGKVSGSSLTPVGFNDAIAKIKLEAAM